MKVKSSQKIKEGKQSHPAEGIVISLSANMSQDAVILK